MAAHFQHVVAADQAAENGEHRHPLTHLEGLGLGFGRHPGTDRFLDPGHRVAQVGQLGQRATRPRFARWVRHRGARHQFQRQKVSADLLGLTAGVEHEVPPQQGRAGLGPEQRGQFLVRRDLGIPGLQPVVPPAQGVVLGERGARAAGVTLPRLAGVDRVAFHRPPPDDRTGPHHRAAPAAGLDQALMPQQRYGVPDDDLGHPVEPAQLLDGWQARTRRILAGLDLLTQFIRHKKVGGAFLHGRAPPGPDVPPGTLCVQLDTIRISHHFVYVSYGANPPVSST